MLKIIILCLCLFGLGFLIVHESWYVTLTAFGYQITTSVVLFAIALLIIFYLLYLIQKPFGWIKLYKQSCSLQKIDKRETYLTHVLSAFLSGDEIYQKQLLKEQKKCYDGTCLQSQLVRALFQPTPELFEGFLEKNETRLIGLKGLLENAWEKGDLQEASKLLEKAKETAPNVPWVKRAYFKMMTAGHDWEGALLALEDLKKSGLVNKECYKKQKACLLLKTKKFKEAFTTAPEMPAIALAYAAEKPEKAAEILTSSWEKAPCFDIFEAYEKLIESFTPAKRVKAVEKFIGKNKAHKLSILALAQTALNAHLWGMAKEQMEIYLRSYPLTAQAALLMARVEREGWNHEEEALKWEEKAKNAENKAGWFCNDCGHETGAFEETCPRCQNFGTICYKN